MTLLSWRNDYLLHIPQIDDEHHQLFDLINEFHDHMHAGDPQSLARELLNALVRYAETHFAHEEQMMERAQFPGLAGHREIHARMVEQIFALNERIGASGRGAFDVKTLTFLKSWLVDHILHEDLRYREFLLARARQS